MARSSVSESASAPPASRRSRGRASGGASAIVEAGLVCVSYDWVGLLFPGQYGLTPGVDLEAVTPEGYGSKPTTPAIGPIETMAFTPRGGITTTVTCIHLPPALVGGDRIGVWLSRGAHPFASVTWIRFEGSPCRALGADGLSAPCRDSPW